MNIKKCIRCMLSSAGQRLIKHWLTTLCGLVLILGTLAAAAFYEFSNVDTGLAAVLTGTGLVLLGLKDPRGTGGNSGEPPNIPPNLKALALLTTFSALSLTACKHYQVLPAPTLTITDSTVVRIRPVPIMVLAPADSLTAVLDIAALLAGDTLSAATDQMRTVAWVDRSSGTPRVVVKTNIDPVEIRDTVDVSDTTRTLKQLEVRYVPSNPPEPDSPLKPYAWGAGIGALLLAGAYLLYNILRK